MSFEENLKNFRFTEDYRDIFDACLRFAAFLEKGGVKVEGCKARISHRTQVHR